MEYHLLLVLLTVKLSSQTLQIKRPTTPGPICDGFNLYPDKNSCRNYYRCVKGKLVQKTCPAINEFSPVYHWCLPPKLAQCSLKKISLTPQECMELINVTIGGPITPTTISTETPTTSSTDLSPCDPSKDPQCGISTSNAPDELTSPLMTSEPTVVTSVPDTTISSSQGEETSTIESLMEPTTFITNSNAPCNPSIDPTCETSPEQNAGTELSLSTVTEEASANEITEATKTDSELSSPASIPCDSSTDSSCVSSTIPNEISVVPCDVSKETCELTTPKLIEDGSSLPTTDSQLPATLPLESCAKYGVRNDPSDCHSFYLCVDGTWHHMKCPGSMEFSVTNMWCMPPDMARCTVTTPKNPENPTTPSSNISTFTEDTSIASLGPSIFPSSAPSREVSSTEGIPCDSTIDSTCATSLSPVESSTGPSAPNIGSTVAISALPITTPCDLSTDPSCEVKSTFNPSETESLNTERTEAIPSWSESTVDPSESSPSTESAATICDPSKDPSCELTSDVITVRPSGPSSSSSELSDDTTSVPVTPCDPLNDVICEKWSSTVPSGTSPSIETNEAKIKPVIPDGELKPGSESTELISDSSTVTSLLPGAGSTEGEPAWSEPTIVLDEFLCDPSKDPICETKPIDIHSRGSTPSIDSETTPFGSSQTPCDLTKYPSCESHPISDLSGVPTQGTESTKAIPSGSSQNPCDTTKDPLCQSKPTVIPSGLATQITESTVTIPSASSQTSCDLTTDPTCVINPIVNPDESTTPSKESTESIASSSPSCDPLKDPTCDISTKPSVSSSEPPSAGSTEALPEPGGSSTPISELIVTSVTPCDSYNDPTCQEQPSTAPSGGSSLNSESTEITTSVSTIAPCDPSNDPKCKSTLTTESTVTSASASSITSCDPSNDSTCEIKPTLIPNGPTSLNPDVTTLYPGSDVTSCDLSSDPNCKEYPLPTSPSEPNAGSTELITSSMSDMSSIVPSSSSTSETKSPEGGMTTEPISTTSQEPSKQPSTEPYNKKHCIGIEIQSDPTDCEKFYLCVNGSLRQKNCPKHMEFSTVFMMCLPSLLAHCSIEAISSSTPGTSSHTVPDVTTEGTSIDTSSVPISTTSQSKETTTYTTEILNLSQETLSPDSLVTGISDLITTENPNAASTTPPYCTENMLYPNPASCREYYLCENGNLIIKTCPGVQEFSFIYHSCLPPLVAGCIEHATKVPGPQKQTICLEVPENNTETQPTIIPIKPLTTSEATTHMEQTTIGDTPNLTSEKSIEPLEEHSENFSEVDESKHISKNQSGEHETFNDSKHKNENEWSSSSSSSSSSSEESTSPTNSNSSSESYTTENISTENKHSESGAKIILPGLQIEIDNSWADFLPSIKLKASEESSESNTEEKSNEGLRNFTLSFFPQPSNIQHSGSLLHTYLCHHWVSYPNPQDCTKYYTCVQGTLVEASCPQNHEFDEDLQKCLPADEAQCSYKNFSSTETKFDSVEPWWMGSNKSRSSNSNETLTRTGMNRKFISDPLNCGYYIVCISNKCVRVPCPEDLEYSRTESKCLPASEAKCSNRITNSLVKSTNRTLLKWSTNQNKGFHALKSLLSNRIEIKFETTTTCAFEVQDPIYFLTNSEDCTKFKVCSFGNLYEAKCPYDYEFSVKDKNCLPADQFNCQTAKSNASLRESLNSVSITSTTPSITTLTPATAPAESIGDVNWSGKTCIIVIGRPVYFIPDASDCRKYKTCSFGHLYEEVCPYNYEFNENESKCLPASEAKCSNRITNSLVKSTNRTLLKWSTNQNKGFHALKSLLSNRIEIKFETTTTCAFEVQDPIYFLTNSEDCTEFKICSFGNLYEAKCPYDYEFSVKDKNCLPADQFNCQTAKSNASLSESLNSVSITSTTPSITTLTPATAPAESIGDVNWSGKTCIIVIGRPVYFIPDASDCRKYKTCSYGHLYEEVCPYNYEFNENESKCLPASEAKCSNRITNSLVKSTNRTLLKWSTNQNKGFNALKSLLSNRIEIKFETTTTCAFEVQDPIYFLTNSEDCTKFKVCSFGNLYEAKCPYDYEFSVKDKNCLPADQFNCQNAKSNASLRESLNSVSITSTTPSITTLTPATAPAESIGDVNWSGKTCIIVIGRPVYFIPDASDCRKYKTCSFGHLYEEVCPYNYEFNENESKCLPASEAKCSNRITNSLVKSTNRTLLKWSTNQNKGFHALKSLLSNRIEIKFETTTTCAFEVQDPIYFLTNSEDCTKFKICSFGNLYEAKCPYDYEFSVKDKNCLPADQLNCQNAKSNASLRESLNSVSITSTTPSITTLTPATAPAESIGDVNWSGKTCIIVIGRPVYFIPDASDCRKYKTCSFGHLYEEVCPYNYEFNENESKCLPPGPIPCQSDTNYRIATVQCPQGRDKPTYYMDPLNCEYYFTCSNGRSFHQKCADGEEFSPAKLICMPASEAKCRHYAEIKPIYVTDGNTEIANHNGREIRQGNYKNNYLYNLDSDDYVLLHRLRRNIATDGVEIEDKKTDIVKKKHIDIERTAQEGSEEIADDRTVQMYDKEVDHKRRAQKNDEELVETRRAEKTKEADDRKAPNYVVDYNGDFINDDKDKLSDIFMRTIINILPTARQKNIGFIESKAK